MRFVRFVERSEALPEAWFAPVWGVLEGELVYPLAQAPYAGVQVSGPARPLTALRLVAPATPSKLVCVGRNYAEHAAELGNEVPPEPLIFLKPPSTVVGPDAPVVYPGISERVDHEGELALVIGQRARTLREEDAARVIFGYTVANDVTARDLQRKDGQWTRGKGFDTFAPVGPWIDTDFDPANRAVRCAVNGELRQDGNTALLIYSIGRVLAHVTRFMTLEPGDLVLTGTPAGVGAVQPGDVMTVEVEGLGRLTNPVIDEAEARRRGLLP
jgi:2-keto-4-pentenoate hydratase/2-oxohepta-3-ene-1,7-dioic acid hydratase in catechol pathway